MGKVEMFVQKITLDVAGRNLYKYIYAKQGDAGSRFVNAVILANGQTMNIDSSMTAKFRAKKPDGKAVLNDAVVNSDGSVTFELTQQTLAVDGVVDADIVISSESGDDISTASFKIEVEKAPLGSLTDSKNELLLVQKIISDSNKAINDVNEKLAKIKDGVSPTVTTEEVSEGTKVTINDATGSHEFVVKDGTDGEPGESATDAQVSTAVDTWLTAHPEATTTVQDGTVTPEKTTFFEIVTEASANLIDPAGIEAGTFDTSTGAEAASSVHRRTGHIAVTPGRYVYPQNGSALLSGSYVFYNSSGAFVSSGDNALPTAVPATAATVRLTWFHSTSVKPFLGESETGAAAAMEYEEYGERVVSATVKPENLPGGGGGTSEKAWAEILNADVEEATASFTLSDLGGLTDILILWRGLINAAVNAGGYVIDINEIPITDSSAIPVAKAGAAGGYGNTRLHYNGLYWECLKSNGGSSATLKNVNQANTLNNLTMGVGACEALTFRINATDRAAVSGNLTVYGR